MPNTTLFSVSDQKRRPETPEKRKEYISVLLESERLYLTPGFSLQDLSLKTGINIPALSALINKEYGMNFNDFINRFRVRYFQELLKNPKYHQLTLEAVANLSGFNSRTTFIRAFTKFAECSPSSYLKNLKYNEFPN
jgi:AraC-like DNA-binding protein